MSAIVWLGISAVVAIMHILLEGKVIILSVLSILILFVIDSLIVHLDVLLTNLQNILLVQGRLRLIMFVFATVLLRFPVVVLWLLGLRI